MKKRQKKNVKPTCNVCMYPIDKIKNCYKCHEPFHPSCINDYCGECVEDLDIKDDDDQEENDLCGLCDGECICQRDASDEESLLSDSDDEADVNYDQDRFWVKTENDIIDQESSDESVYEEPEESNASDEDIMVEIVREKLINGWTSEEEDEEDEEMFSDIQSIITELPPLPLIIEEKEVEVKPESPKVKPEAEMLPDVVEVEEIPSTQSLKTPQTIKKKKQTQAPIQPVQPIYNQLEPPRLNMALNQNATNPWFALAAMNMNSSFMSYQKPRVDQTPNMTAAQQIASNLLKKPVNMNAVATAAAALMASPAAMRAFSDIRKRELEKMMDSLNQPNTRPKPQQGSSKQEKEKSIVDELSKILNIGTDEKLNDFLLEDIIDLDDDIPVSPKSEDEYSKFRKIPIGTYWNSQRKKKKPKNLQKALKKSTTNKLLDLTLLETLPMKKRKKAEESPMLGPYKHQEPSSFFLN